MTTAPTPLQRSGRAAAITLAVVLGLGLLGSLLVGLWVGAAPAWGVLTGTLMVVGFFGAGICLILVALRMVPEAALLVALMTFTLQMTLLFLAFVLLKKVGLLGTTIDATWLAVTIAVLTVAWTTALIAGLRRLRVPVFDAPKTPSDGDRETPTDGERRVSDETR